MYVDLYDFECTDKYFVYVFMSLVWPTSVSQTFLFQAKTVLPDLGIMSILGIVRIVRIISIYGFWDLSKKTRVEKS